MARYHLIFEGGGSLVAKVAWKNDDNAGLPDWFFDLTDVLSFEVDEEKDIIIWVPAIGPAPCWEEKYSKFSNNEDLFRAFSDWAAATY